MGMFGCAVRWLTRFYDARVQFVLSAGNGSGEQAMRRARGMRDCHPDSMLRYALASRMLDATPTGPRRYQKTSTLLNLERHCLA